jgi:hypothetical protein
MWGVTGVVASALAAIAWGAEPDGGGAPYTPTRAEWLCVLLNADRAVTDGAQFANSGLGVRYHHDHTKPDAIQIEVLYPVRAPKKAVRARLRQADEQAHAMAKLRGWDDWLKTEIVETEIITRPTSEPLEK